jgi:uncharacterized protein (TIGR00730 family)
MNITVFCSASHQLPEKFYQEASEIGALLAEQGHRIIYGGASIGMMGALANGALAKKGKVIGVIPKNILKREIAHDQLEKLIVTEDMHERKANMYQLADCFITLPGGFGTLEETTEIITWNQLEITKKPLFIYNFNGFYDFFKGYIKEAREIGMIAVHDHYIPPIFDTLTELQRAINEFEPPKDRDRS